MNELIAIDYVIIGVYMAGVLVIGSYFAKYMNSADDLFLAGKSLPFWAIGMSIVVSDIGAIDLMTDNVYITFDLDAFDPSILPSTGTPEPGGLQWYETLEFLRRVFAEKNVVGFDLVELCATGNYKPSAFTAAKLYYKMLSYKFEGEQGDFEYDNQEISQTKMKKHDTDQEYEDGEF